MGENIFVAEVQDLAGNVGTARLTIVRDTSPPDLVVDTIPPYSRELNITITGHVTDLLETMLTVNGRLEATLVKGTFSVNLTLVNGRNTLLIEAVDALGNTARSEHLVVQDNLINGSIFNPVEGDVVHRVELVVSVYTDPGAWARVVDHTDWTYTENGTLDLLVRLDKHVENDLLVEFRDAANNTVHDTVTVTHVKVEEDKEWTILLWSIFAVIALVALAVVVIWGLKRRS